MSRTITKEDQIQRVLNRMRALRGAQVSREEAEKEVEGYWHYHEGDWVIVRRCAGTQVARLERRRPFGFQAYKFRAGRKDWTRTLCPVEYREILGYAKELANEEQRKALKAVGQGSMWGES